MYTELLVECNCGCKTIFTKIQFDDFDCGIMGFLKCECGKFIMPGCRYKNYLTITEIEVDGDDRGWS